MPLNLDKVATVAESFMVDVCRIERDDSGELAIGGNWDEVAGEYTPDRVRRSHVYRGACMVYTRQPQASETTQGGAPTAEEQFYMSLPRELNVRNDIMPEDIVTVLVSQDARLVNEVFKIEAVDSGTHLATREVRMCRYTDLVP